MVRRGGRAMVVALLLAGLIMPRVSAAQEVTDAAAAYVVFPYVVVDSANGVDTLLQLGNAGATDVAVRCFYEDATRHCSNAATVACTNDEACGAGAVCTAQWAENEFSVVLSAGQPFAWRASQGNGALYIPAVGEDPFVGALRCVAVDIESFLPVNQNVIEGTAVLDEYRPGASPEFDTARYNAIGFTALGTGNGDGVLSIGTEYAGCASALSFAHFADGAADPVAPQRQVHTRVVAVPCSVDYVKGPASVMVQYAVWNEFGQRLGTSRRVTGQDVVWLSELHPTIFNAATLGTLTAKTVATGIDGGVLLLGIERHAEPDVIGTGSAAFHVEHRGSRTTDDVVVLPPLL